MKIFRTMGGTKALKRALIKTFDDHAKSWNKIPSIEFSLYCLPRAHGRHKNHVTKINSDCKFTFNVQPNDVWEDEKKIKYENGFIDFSPASPAISTQFEIIFPSRSLAFNSQTHVEIIIISLPHRYTVPRCIALFSISQNYCCRL